MSTPNVIYWNSPDADFRLQVAGTMLNHVMTQEYGLRCTYSSRVGTNTGATIRQFTVSPHQHDLLHKRYGWTFQLAEHTTPRVDPTTHACERVVALCGCGKKRVSWKSSIMPERAIEMVAAWNDGWAQRDDPRTDGWVTNGLTHYVEFKGALGMDPLDLQRSTYLPDPHGGWSLWGYGDPKLRFNAVHVQRPTTVEQLAQIALMMEKWDGFSRGRSESTYSTLSSVLVDAIHGRFRVAPPIEQEAEARAFIQKHGTDQHRTLVQLIDAERGLIDDAARIKTRLP